MADLDELDPLLTRPLYTRGEVAALLGLPTATVHGWALRRSYRGADGSQRQTVPLVTATAAEGRSVPFLGFAEAYVLAVFASAGVSVIRLRPTLSFLARELDPISPLTSEALLTEGPAVLARSDDPAVFAEIVDVDRVPATFRPDVEQHLGRITYRGGRASAVVLPRRGPTVIVDPRVNLGRPSLAAGAVALEEVFARLRAGEAVQDVADDLGLDVADVRSLGG